MYSTALLVHNWMRWIVLVTALLALARGASGWGGQKPWTSADDRSTLWFTIALDLQVTIGLILYAALSPITQVAFADFGAAMRDNGLRFWAVEHLVGMMIALGLAHVARVLIRRSPDDATKFRRATLFIGMSVFLMMLSIPWPGNGHRPAVAPVVKGPLYTLTTDRGAPVARSPAAALDPAAAGVKRWRKRDAARLGRNGAYRFEDPAANITAANCHGTTFDRGGSHIFERPVDIILRDNYAKVDVRNPDPGKRQRAAVCDIVVWNAGDFPRHSALIIEVDASGQPSMVVGKNGSDGELWAHPPDNFDVDWDAFTRTGTDSLDQATRDSVDTLRDEYDAAQNGLGGEPLTSAVTARHVHHAAYEWCRRKNALTRV